MHIDWGIYWRLEEVCGHRSMALCMCELLSTVIDVHPFQEIFSLSFRR